MKNINWTFIIVALILGVAFVGYGAFDYLAKTNQLAYAQQKEDSKAEEITRNRKDLSACVNEVKVNIKKRWDTLCKAKGLDDDCLQPLEVVATYDKRAEFARNECIKKYPLQ